MKKNNINKGMFPYLILLLVIGATIILTNIGSKKVNKFTYDEFLKKLESSEVTEIEITPKNSGGVYVITGKLEKYDKHETFTVNAPLSEVVLDKVLSYSDEKEMTVKTNNNPENSVWIGVITNVLPIILLVIATFYLFSKLSSGNNKSMDFGRSKAKMYADDKKAKFKDVAGLREEKEELEELIEFLKNPKRFQKMGARIPKGVLLVGPPGTGKTLLARAVAGEADVPFFYISGSDFVELFVGVGASRVRDMFKQAKHSAPCLIFIDEIDAVGRQRGTGLGGGHDEREQTLNQLLTEMDGFGANEGIIIIAATNRPDVLDPALLRPGRFDRQVMVNLPDTKEREDILKVHAKGKILADNINLKNVAKRTPGFSGAGLENLLNEAALLTVRRNKPAITMSEIDEATDRVLMGPAKVTREVIEREKRLVGIHESGHAVIGIKLENANIVQKITIVPRGMAGGYTMMIPKEDTMISTKNELIDSITGLLGGRVAEELFLGEVSTGASDDFARATKLARAMVCEYGMSDLGPMQYETRSGDVFLGRDYTKSRNFSDAVALEIDQEVRHIIDGCYKKAQAILKKEEKLVLLLTDTLMKKETLTAEEIEELVETGKLSSEDESEE